jgi:hypothetical protein
MTKVTTWHYSDLGQIEFAHQQQRRGESNGGLIGGGHQ